ncbi:cell wall-associated NlpC family hydrolase [Winogradskyella wandonensis]|uniref:Cell wall-associated NlpC family hydrolase n=1 Tax=Winogradskyella wandonensis TaxID=1442586 RepID=A0A4R1KT17_9FLAO|nr:C40 family peptidase [Winogradskyella wandonensis]TCK67409.1 cell wall-associated NlpC family hydrolase [Winogradskyella wandonensis]
MRKTYLLFILLALLSSCGSSRKASKSSKRKTVITTKTTSKNQISDKAQSIINYAKTFKGTRYKYGGTTKKGMDCSGLIYASFGAHDVVMPRTTQALSSAGDWVDIKKVQEGDLVFFATKKNSRKVNHVGIVTEVKNGDISFIHASTSRGVMISKVSERYWYLAYVQARRYL